MWSKRWRHASYSSLNLYSTDISAMKLREMKWLSGPKLRIWYIALVWMEITLAVRVLVTKIQIGKENDFLWTWRIGSCCNSVLGSLFVCRSWFILMSYFTVETATISIKGDSRAKWNRFKATTQRLSFVFLYRNSRISFETNVLIVIPPDYIYVTYFIVMTLFVSLQGESVQYYDGSVRHGADCCRYSSLAVDSLLNTTAEPRIWGTNTSRRALTNYVSAAVCHGIPL